MDRFNHHSLRFEPLSRQDKGDFVSLYCNPVAMQHIADRSVKHQAEARFEQIFNEPGRLHYRKICSQDNQFVGLIGIIIDKDDSNRGTFGMILAPKWHGAGIGTFALQSLLKLGFVDYHLDYMYASFRVANQAIHHVVNKVKLRVFNHHLASDGHTIWDCDMSKEQFIQHYGIQP